MISEFQTISYAVMIASGGLTLALIYLSVVDIATRRIPNWLNLSLVMAGMVVTWVINPQLVLQHALAAGAGFLFFYLFNTAYVLLRKRQGLGGGDAKLFGAAGAWLGFLGLPSVLLYACASAFVLMAGFVLCRKRLSLSSAIAFGPHLSIGIWFTWVFGPLVLF